MCKHYLIIIEKIQHESLFLSSDFKRTNHSETIKVPWFPRYCPVLCCAMRPGDATSISAPPGTWHYCLALSRHQLTLPCWSQLHVLCPLTCAAPFSPHWADHVLCCNLSRPGHLPTGRPTQTALLWPTPAGLQTPDIKVEVRLS